MGHDSGVRLPGIRSKTPFRLSGLQNLSVPQPVLQTGLARLFHGLFFGLFFSRHGGPVRRKEKIAPGRMGIPQVQGAVKERFTVLSVCHGLFVLPGS